MIMVAAGTFPVPASTAHLNKVLSKLSAKGAILSIISFLPVSLAACAES